MLYEFTSPATIWKWKQAVTQARASGLVMFNGIIHLTCVLSILYPIESQHSCNWTTTYNLHQTCILCDTYYMCNSFNFSQLLWKWIWKLFIPLHAASFWALQTHCTYTCDILWNGWVPFPFITSVHLEFIGYMNTWLNNPITHMYTTPQQHYRPSRQKSTFSLFTGLKKFISHLSPSLSLPVLLAASAASPSCPAPAQWGSALGWWGCAGNQRQ